MNWTYCNTTAEDMEISEEPLWEGGLRFHDLAIIIAGTSSIFAMILSFYLIFKHATNYTQPDEQRNIIRILLMVPIYAVSNFLELKFYHHAVYYSVISDCYEAFAISSFFALMCQYVAHDLHEQKKFFRQLQPLKPWVWPVTWFKKCCGGERGPWRTPKSGLTWFNIIWIGIYHYCFIRVAMTITAVVAEHFDRYCEASNSPYFAHVWCLAINSLAVTIAMFCVIQYYVQLKVELTAHKPFLKVLAIKGVIFLSFWQSTAISLATSEFNIISSNSKLSYPDIATGIPALLLCFEMFLFAIVHIFAYPWKPYREGAPAIFYPKPSIDAPDGKENIRIPPSGGFMGLKAIWDALNIFDVIKAFGRGMRWLFVGVKHRHLDVSYTKNTAGDFDMDGRSTYGMNEHLDGRKPLSAVPEANEEGAGLIAHAQDHPSSRAPSPYREYDSYREDQPYESDLGYRGAQQLFRQEPTSYEPQPMSHQYRPPVQHFQEAQTQALSRDDYNEVPGPTRQDTGQTYVGYSGSTRQGTQTPPEGYSGALRQNTQQPYHNYSGGSAEYSAATRQEMQPSYTGPSGVPTGNTQQSYGEFEGGLDDPGQNARRPRDSTQMKIGEALWGHNPHQHPGGPMI